MILLEIVRILSNFVAVQEANFDHRIQPETESLIKMIMDTPFVVRILCIFFKHLYKYFPSCLPTCTEGTWWPTTRTTRA